MAKQLNVSLAFTADTSKAKAELQDLQKQLTQLINSVGTNKQLTGLNSEIQKSVSAAAKLKVQLESATNVDTGKLDLGKFNDALNKGGISLKQYQSLLSNLGSAGDQAFASLTKSIMNAEVPLKRSNTLLTEFATTLKNTARWQISSSILHGFMGSLQSAYGYAQDLNQSLNNIRIVTGYNTDQMSKFAEQANKAAQSLSTTTTRYTDAALIYYQQGLSDEEVLGRAETTIKLANVSRQSTEEVSDQLTAIWNNFYDGSQNLEYYADVITALGAATASSSEEISTGLEKFAAVSKTVGLSYEYATAALATITATTRQSADTVGTGLRTLFTRLEGLKLGETLEDGVDLNKYSEALQSVGVQVLDTSGNLREMDDILEDLGSKWGQLERSQKMALAQTVGGVRQYTNLIALMDHWDFMQENLATARGSEGTLQQQADIYAESWEAAEKRVRAAAEAIYSDLINDDFFITILNGFEKVLQEIDIFIDSMGGLKGAISIVGTALMTVFNKDIATNLDNIIYSISMMTPFGRAKVEGRRQEAINALIDTSANGITDSEIAAADVYRNQAQSQQLLLDNNDRLSEQEKQQIQLLLDQQEILGQQVIESAKLVEQTRNKSDQLTDETRNYADKGDNEFDSFEYDEQSQALREATKRYIEQKGAKQELLRISKSESKNISELEKAYNQYSSKITLTKEQEDALNEAHTRGAEAYKQELQNIAQSVTSTKEYTDAEKALAQTIQEGGTSKRDAAASAKDLKDAYIEEAQAAENQRRANENLKGSYETIAETIQNAKGHFLSTGEAISLGAQQIMALSMAINALKGLGNIWNNEDLSIGEKILQTVSTLAITVPMLTNAFNAEKIAKMSSFMASSLLGISYNSLTIASKAEAMATLDQTKDQVLLNAAKKAGIPITAETTKGELAATLAKEVEHGVNLKLISSQILLNAQFWLAVAAIAAVVAIINSLVKAYNKSADDAKKASEASKKLTEQYQKTKDSYEELKKSIEDHNNAVKAIDKLKKGTEEWRDAIQEANEKVLELIGNYPTLAAAISRNQDGILTIDQNSSIYKEYLKKETDKLNSAFQGQIAGQIFSRNADYENNLVQASRNIFYKSNSKSYLDEYGNENIGFEQISSELLKKAVELYNQNNSLFNEKYKDQLAKQLDISNELCEALILNKEKISELSIQLSANTDSNKLAAEQIGMNEFAKNNTNFTEQEIQAVSSLLGNNFIYELSKQQSLWSNNNDGKIYEAQNLYASAMGYTVGNRKNGTFDYKDSQNNIINLPESVAVNFVATQKALENIANNAEKAKQAIEGLQIGAKNLGNEIGDNDSAFGILTGVSGGKDFNFSELTEEQFEGIKRAWKAASADGAMSAEEFYSYFGISDEYARSKGYESGLAMAQAFANGIDNYAHDVKYKNILDSLMPTAKPFEEASANYNTITSTRNKITDDNYILDDKSYQELKAAGIAVNQYFEQMADGTHLLTSSVSDFKSAIDNVANSELYTALANQEKITGSLEAYSASGGISSLLTDQDKNNILQFSGVSSKDIANIQMIEDSMARMDAYAEKFKELGLTGNIEKINELLQQSADETQKIQDAIENSQFKDKVTDSGLDLEETIEYSKYLQRLVKNEEDAYIGADKLSEELIDNDKAAKNLSLQVQKMNKGVESLSKNWKNWSDMLKNSSKGSKEYYDALDDTKEALSDLLDISEDFIDDEFVDSLANDADSMKLMEEAAKGNGDAIDALRQKTLDNLILKLEIHSDDLDNKTLLDRVHELQNMLDEMGPIEAGATIDTSGLDAGEAEFLAALNQLIADAGMGKEAVNAMLSGMGYTANFASEPQKVVKREPDEVTTHVTKVSKGIQPIEGGGSVEEYDMVTTTETKPGKVVEGEEPVSSMVTSEPGTTVVPKINSVIKNASGSANNSSSSNSGGSSSGKGGGGGGGSSKAYTPRKRKTDDAEKERYIEINAQLKTTSQLLNTINTAKDRAYGGARVKHIDEEISALNREYGQLQQLIKEDEEWLKKDKGKIAEYGLKTGWDNNINNYDEIFDAEKAKLIAAYDLFDQKMQSAIDEAEKKELEKEIEEAEERFDKFQEVVNQYHTTLQKLEDDRQTATENRNKVYDNELEKITHMIDVWDDYYDRELKYLDFLLNQIGDGADRALDRMDNYTEKMGRTFDKIDNFQEGIEETLDHMGLSLSDLEDGFNKVFDGDNWTKDIDALKNYQDSLISLGNELLELRRTLLEEVSAAFDEFNSDLDRAVDGVDHLRRFTETYKNILDIVGKDVIDPTGRTTNMLARTAFTQAQANANALQTQLDMQLSAIDDYNRTIANLQSDNRYGEHDDTIKEFKNQLKEAEDAYAATQEEWLGAWEETVQAAADIYETTMLQIIEDFGKSISGLAGSLEELDTRFNRAKSLADTYVDDYEKIYQLSKLNRDINNSIDDTDNIRSKQRLRDLQEQINDLQASDNQMSEYEIENLRRRYELELAYLQLEEARDAKSQVRMVRDNEGNWGYIYTADETAVEEAEQNYEDKLYAMQKANTEYIESLESEILQLEQEWSDALAGIRVQDYASYEEYQEAIDRTNDYYTQKLDQTYEQMGIAIDNNKVLYDEDWAAYSAATGYKISEDERFIDDFKETTLSLTTGYQTIEDAQNAFRDATLNVTNDMVQAFQDWERDTNTSLELGGTNIQNYAEDVNEAINGDGGIVDQTEDAVEAVEIMSDEYQDAFTEIIDYAGTFCSQFNSVIDDIVNDCNRAIEAIQNLLEAMGEEVENNNNNNEDTYANWEAQFDKEGKLSGWKAKDRNGNYITGSGKKLYWGGNEQISGYTTTYDFDANGNLIIDGKNAIGSGFAGSTLSEEMKRKLLKEAAHADTGMYTGNWGSSEGRLAVLHEKELVLDKDDTSNFLSAIGMIRDISSMIDLNSITSSNLMASMFGIRGVSTGTDTLEQDVTIHAEFPNVQNHSEIEEAFDNLINKASQYANRKI